MTSTQQLCKWIARSYMQFSRLFFSNNATKNIFYFSCLLIRFCKNNKIRKICVLENDICRGTTSNAELRRCTLFNGRGGFTVHLTESTTFASSFNTREQINPGNLSLQGRGFGSSQATGVQRVCVLINKCQTTLGHLCTRHTLTYCNKLTLHGDLYNFFCEDFNK